MDWGGGMRALLTIVCLSSMAVASYAQSKSESRTLPPEVKRTVDALVGRWSFRGSDVETGVQEPLTVSMEIDCRTAVLGTAVACTLRGNIENSGPIEAATIVGYDPDEQTVHWMEISSTGEYHDHKGKWKGGMIVFEPLVYLSAGKKYTERFTLSFPSVGTFTLNSVTEVDCGPIVNYGHGNKTLRLNRLIGRRAKPRNSVLTE